MIPILRNNIGFQSLLSNEKRYTRVSLSVRNDNEAAPLSVQGGVLVIRTLLSVQVGLVIRTRGGLVIRIYKWASLSAQIKDVRINFVRIVNQAEGVSLSVHVPITRP